MEISTTIPLIVSGIYIYIYRQIFLRLDRIKQGLYNILPTLGENHKVK